MLFQKKSYDYKELAKKWVIITPQASPSNEFYKKSLNFIVEALKASGGCLLLKDFEKETFSVKCCLDGRHFSFQNENCLNLIQWFKKNKRALSRQQILEDPKHFPIKIQWLNFFLQFHAEVCAPLWYQEDLIGFVVLSLRRNGRPYTEACLEVLDWLSSQISPFLQNSLLHEKIRTQKAELEAMGDLKSQIIANLSHELRTPLTSILGFAELLSEEIDGSLNEEQKRHLSQVIEGGGRLLKTLSALVDMAKLEAGQYPLNISQFHLLPLVEGLTEGIPFNGATVLHVALDNQTPFVYGDLQLVRQIFVNLLDNAAKYTHQGSVEISASKKGEMLEICIADTGIGIAEEKLTDIFQGFYQVNGGLTREFQGTGVGLNLAKKLVEIHGGRLWVRSKPGLGSHFYFTLPLKPVVIKHRELAA